MNVQSVSYFPSFLCFSGSAWDECEKSCFPLDIRSDWFLKSYLFQNFLVEVKKKKTCELWSRKENLSLQSFGFHDWPSIHGKEQSFSISASFPWHLAEIISKDTVLPLIFLSWIFKYFLIQSIIDRAYWEACDCIGNFTVLKILTNPTCFPQARQITSVGILDATALLAFSG